MLEREEDPEVDPVEGTTEDPVEDLEEDPVKDLDGDLFPPDPGRPAPLSPIAGQPGLDGVI